MFTSRMEVGVSKREQESMYVFVYDNNNKIIIIADNNNYNKTITTTNRISST